MSNATDALSALSYPGRLEIFRLLVPAGQAGMAAGEIARALSTPANTLSTQLAILSRAGLIQARREGRSIIYAANFAQVTELIGFLLKDCCQGRPEVCTPVAAFFGSGCMPNFPKEITT